jgi:CheY-like chemotaxis protein
MRHITRCSWRRVPGRCRNGSRPGAPCGLARKGGAAVGGRHCSAERAFDIRTLSCAELALHIPGPAPKALTLSAWRSVLRHNSIQSTMSAMSSPPWAMSEGFQVTNATSAIEALVRLRWRLPDLVVADEPTPGMSGLELCQRLRPSPEPARFPIILHIARSLPAGSLHDIVFSSKPPTLSHWGRSARYDRRRTDGSSAPSVLDGCPPVASSAWSTFVLAGFTRCLPKPAPRPAPDQGSARRKKSSRLQPLTTWQKGRLEAPG